ncbi:GNAT family N-acetyltransferase [Virgibacillus sp. MSP4-1]|uniref:GNAT family N-acetyltransferase n=1 Tax=Virgibacillus sp. MSP4-1 TaxID=2700081 RepID=UPI0003A7DD50|nr:GNAT family N-acetyltransferase [Virgibacillus sp. MSP4-1]QHS23724.1 GNAT family N-acetyltransferase [Virgibacillus sp. MSP4-1]
MRLFNVIKNEKKYWLVDQIQKDNVDQAQYKEQLSKILQQWKEGRSGFLSLLMDEAYEEWLLKKPFQKVSTIVEYTRDLEGLPRIHNDISYACLSDRKISEDEYKWLYGLCRSGTANKNDLQENMDEVLDSVKKELGPNWKDHCYYFTKDQDYLGMAIPHIEMGTKDEGRLFYFGVVPDKRSQGVGKELHKGALEILRTFGAAKYVGSTDIHNEAMIRIFQKNGGRLRDGNGIYRIEKETTRG